MEDEQRGKKKHFFGMKPRGENSSARNSRHDNNSVPHAAAYEKRRMLNSYDLQPPDYLLKPQHLIEDHVEKAVLFAGEIDGVSPHTDITNRTDVLRIIDKGKKQEMIPGDVSLESHHAILSLSVFNIKISRYNATEDTLLRIPMHEIAAICYIKDDQQHILAIKFGSPEFCKLAVLYCENKASAEEICALVGQCFHHVYTEATVYLLERQIKHLDIGGSTSTGTVASVSTIVNKLRGGMHSFDTDSRLSRVPSDSESGRNSDSVTGEELLKDYMTKLMTKLEPEELRRFAQYLQDWKCDNDFIEFCDKVLNLLGQNRKQLLSEMLPFIPVDNYQYFEEFLRRNGIIPLENTSTMSSSRTNLRSYPTRRSLGEVSTTSSVSNNVTTSGEALDHLLDFANVQYNSVDIDMDPSKYVPSEDY